MIQSTHRMQWDKKGLCFSKENLPQWAQQSALQPTPLLLNKDVIRVFVGMRDNEGISRIGYVDLNAQDPSCILDISRSPLLDIGVPGSFDDNGVVPTAVIFNNNTIYLYYAGYNLGHNVRFCAYAGLAISKDVGKTFKRVQTIPVFERTESELLFRVPHSVIVESEKWRFWYGGGNKFIVHQGKTVPTYDIKYLESSSPTVIPSVGKTILTFRNADEYRVARPYVVFDQGIYKMFCCIGTFSKGYRLGYAESEDGIKWNRCDEKLGIDVSSEGSWDSEMMAYPSFIRTSYGSYLFYNGNNYGEQGFGYAVLLEP